LIGLFLGKIISLPVMLPSTNGSNKLIETIEKRSKRNGWLKCRSLLTHCPLSIVRIHKVKLWNEYKTKFCEKEDVELAY